LKLGHHEKALEDAEQCIKLDPTSVKGHFRRGKPTVVICCCCLLFVVARGLNRTLGLSLHAMGRYGEAVVALQKAKDLDPGNKQISAALQVSEFKARTAASEA